MIESQNADVKLSREELAREMKDEIARIHTLIDRINDELSRHMSADCAEVLHTR